MVMIAEMSPELLELVGCPVLKDVTDHLARGVPPVVCPLSIKSLRSSRIFTMDDGISSWVWVGKYVPEWLCSAVFGEEDIEAIESIDFDAEEGRKLIALLKRPLRLCIEGGTGSRAFTARLVDSEGSGMPGLKGFLWRVTRAISRS
jgi:hypothetical protein